LRNPAAPALRNPAPVQIATTAKPAGAALFSQRGDSRDQAGDCGRHPGRPPPAAAAGRPPPAGRRGGQPEATAALRSDAAIAAAAAPGSAAPVIGRPMTRRSAPARSDSSGVATRA
jgi:hypothetical protein